MLIAALMSYHALFYNRDIAKLYGARWDTELLFKELKNKYALDFLETKNMQVIEEVKHWIRM